jgi:hypothetical protein
VTNLIHIGDITLHAAATGHDEWIGSLLQGWHSSPPMRGDTDERPGADGAFGSSKNYRSARSLTLSGHVLTDSVSECQGLMDSFAAIQADGKPIRVGVENDLGIRMVTATLNGSAEVVPDPNFMGAALSAQFIAYDPIKYGPQKSSSSGLQSPGGGLVYPLHSPSGALSYGALGALGRITLTNDGTADVYPTFTITGQLDDGFYIQALETGDVIRYERVVPAGTTVGVNSRTESITIDGVPGNSGYLTRFEWFAVPRKSFLTVQMNAIGGSSGSPTMTATMADGWW